MRYWDFISEPIQHMSSWNDHDDDGNEFWIFTINEREVTREEFAAVSERLKVEASKWPGLNVSPRSPGAEA